MKSEHFSSEMDELLEDYTDATDTIEVYEKGKVWWCPSCGKGIGTKHIKPVVRCYSCDTTLCDKRNELREDEYEPNEGGQTKLGDFM
jgi:predicted RNA-binding Zn-ribbon protein involved in translation (DUF1610 family)